MTPFEKFIDNLINFEGGFNLWSILKILALILLLFYIVFGVAVIRQVGLMSKALNGSLEFPVKIIAWIHLGLIIFLFILALLAL